MEDLAILQPWIPRLFKESAVSLKLLLKMKEGYGAPSATISEPGCGKLPTLLGRIPVMRLEVADNPVFREPRGDNC
jgi:hypothetical protein